MMRDSLPLESSSYIGSESGNTSFEQPQVSSKAYCVPMSNYTFVTVSRECMCVRVPAKLYGHEELPGCNNIVCYSA